MQAYLTSLFTKSGRKPMNKPTAEDIRKIHAEVNQLLNQRFLLTTLSTTIFGVALSWLIPKETPLANSNLSNLSFALSLILSVVLFSLYLLHHFLRGMQILCTSYLATTNSSTWEKHWNTFRKKPYYGYTKPQTVIFLILNAISTVFPYMLALAYSQKIESFILAFLSLAIGTVVEVMIYRMGFGQLFELRSGAETNWKSILTEEE